ncbi:MAG: hypothetical protein ABL309_04900 [Phycisphaerales bacterium]
MTLLTAKTSPNPAFEQDIRAFAASQQRDASAPNRHTELVRALQDLWAEHGNITQRTLDDWRSENPDNNFIPYALDFYAPLAEPEFTNERHLIEVEISNSVVQELASRSLAQPVFAVLEHPNLTNDYSVRDNQTERYTPLWLRSHEEVIDLRNLVALQAIRTRLQVDAEEYRAASETLLETSLIPQYLSRQASMVEHLTAFACCSVILDEIEAIAIAEDLDAEVLAVLSQTLDQTRDLGDFSVALEAQYIELKDSLFALHSASGRMIPSSANYLHDERAYSLHPPTRHEPTIAERFFDIRGFMMASRDEHIEFARQAIDLILPAAETEDAQARKKILKDFDVFASKHKGRLRLTSDALRIGTPESVNAYWQIQSDFTRTEAILAMAAYRFDHGDWPERLDQLIPEYLDTIPINPLTGDPFEYARAPGEAPSLESFGIEEQN